jgi:hypothetical protein
MEMLELNKNDGTVKSFASSTELCNYLMAIENEKLLGCDLYLMLERDLPGGHVPPERTPAVIRSEKETYSLMVNTRNGMKCIADPAEIGIELDTLDALFARNQPEGKIFLVWDSPLLEAIKTKGGHNKFWGDHVKDPWSFLVLTPNRIAVLLSTLRKPHDFLMLQEAWEKQLTVVELCKGDFKGLKQIMVETGVDIEALRKAWCFEYCQANSMTILEKE